MTARRVNEWTETTEEAFGKSAKNDRGVTAEEIYENYAKNRYVKVVNNAKDRLKQRAGLDFEVWTSLSEEPIGIDVKSTLNQYGVFTIENWPNGWIRSPDKKTKNIVHLNTTDFRAIEYDRESMRVYLDTVIKSKDELVRLEYDNFEFDGSTPGPLIYRKFWIS